MAGKNITRSFSVEFSVNKKHEAVQHSKSGIHSKLRTAIYFQAFVYYQPNCVQICGEDKRSIIRLENNENKFVQHQAGT